MSGKLNCFKPNLVLPQNQISIMFNKILVQAYPQSFPTAFSVNGNFLWRLNYSVRVMTSKLYGEVQVFSY